MQTPQSGQKASYRCACGYFYECSIVNANGDGTLDIEVSVPTAPLLLTKRAWWPERDPAGCPRGAVMRPGIMGAIR